jgi:DNA-binding MarR family transcriptional regulator
VNGPDVLKANYYRPLFRLLESMDDDISALYVASGQAGVRPRFVGPLLFLADVGSATVTELSAARDVTHSAMSQTVSAMAAAELVDVQPGSDARNRLVSLSSKGSALVPLLQVEWSATEAVVRALDEEIDYPLMQAVASILEALKTKPFEDRLREQLAALRGTEGGNDGAGS